MKIKKNLLIQLVLTYVILQVECQNYGNLTIQEYRKLLKSERLLLIVDKPLTRILPELHHCQNLSGLLKIYSFTICGKIGDEQLWCQRLCHMIEARLITEQPQAGLRTGTD